MSLPPDLLPPAYSPQYARARARKRRRNGHRPPALAGALLSVSAISKPVTWADLFGKKIAGAKATPGLFPGRIEYRADGPIIAGNPPTKDAR
jgi:hypothetical protein